MNGNKAYTYFHIKRDHETVSTILKRGGHEDTADVLTVTSEQGDTFKVRIPRHAWSMTVTPKGVAINGDYGTNPSAAEMREMVEIMREMVAFYDSFHEEGETQSD